MLSAALVLVLLAGVATWLVVARTSRPVPDDLVRTPPMGWNDWNAYGCDVSEALIKQTADRIVSTGLAAAGYRYVNIDDRWMQQHRDESGNLQPDFDKFPDGISGTAAYVHAKGLKLGIYADAGTDTCAGYPGSLGHEGEDARQFASWGVDYLKYDNCSSNGGSTTADYVNRYSVMRDALAATGRPIVYSIGAWGLNAPWTWGGGIGNLWRTTGDIGPSFSSMLSIFHANVGLDAYARPGAWNDPDMLEVGNGMSSTEDRAQFSLWAEMAAPLLAGNDLANASGATLSILGNRSVIAVYQDPLGRQGVLVSSSDGLDVLAKPLANGDVSVLLFNENGSTRDRRHLGVGDREERCGQLHAARPVDRGRRYHHRHDQRERSRPWPGHVPGGRRYPERRYRGLNRTVSTRSGREGTPADPTGLHLAIFGR